MSKKNFFLIKSGHTPLMRIVINAFTILAFIFAPVNVRAAENRLEKSNVEESSMENNIANPEIQTTPTPFMHLPFHGNYPPGSIMDHDSPRSNNKQLSATYFDGQKYVSMLFASIECGNYTYENYRKDNNSPCQSYEGHSGYDFPMPNGTKIYPVATGKYYDKGSYGVVVHDGDGEGYETWYVHIRKSLLSNGSKITDINTPIAESGSGHLHLTVLKNGKYTDPYGWWSSDPDPLGSLSNGSASDWLWVDPPPNYCPKAGGVILYKDSNFDCSIGGEGVGWVQYNAPGFYNLPSTMDNQASSIRVPQGWSVRLYAGIKSNWGFACRKNDDDNFFGDVFNNGTTLNDNVTSIEIFDNITCGGDLPPEAPVLLSPRDNSISMDGKAPRLCWSAFDPNGDVLSYEVTVGVGDTKFDSGVTADPIRCWTPSKLDNQDGFYYWWVTAYDGKLFGPPSSSWKFEIDLPPSINFESANNDPFPTGTIYSSQRDWTFTGTASDPDNQLSEVKMMCIYPGPGQCGTQTSPTGTSSWTHQLSGLSGKYVLAFVAYTSDGNYAISRPLTLNIDLAAPTTSITLNDDRNPSNWVKWFRSPVVIKAQAVDNGTGEAKAGVKQIYYRLDGGDFQSQNASNVTLPVNSDGVHAFEYYAVDQAGNKEATQSITFKIDQQPPPWPVSVTENHQVEDGNWQNENNIPSFSWTPVSDLLSGLSGYQFYFGLDPNGIGYFPVLATETPSYDPYPIGVHTGEYFLRGRVQDVAGNWSSWETLFTFRYDSTPPENPRNVIHAAGVTTAWQNVTNQADFSWPVPKDEGSGIKGYYVYWGTDPNGTSTTFITSNSYEDTSPLCALDSACIGYLRLRSVDNIDNLAKEWTTTFVLRYDNAPPVVDFTFNGGVTTTSQTQVMLDVQAQDEGSGVAAVRFSEDGIKWLDWEAPAAQRPWTLPAVNRQLWSVYTQGKDHTGLLSAVVSHNIFLDVNVGQPRSNEYRLFDYASSSGSVAYQSNEYTGRGVLGQPLDSTSPNSLHYQIASGYEAGSQALPLIIPSHDVFKYINGSFSSGIVYDAVESPSYSLIFSQGEIGLPTDTTLLNSPGYQHTPGFLAAAPTALLFPDQQEMPPPAEEPGLSCQSPSIRINDGAMYTNEPGVTLSICAPYGAQMKISNFENFAGAGWEDYHETKAWRISTQGATTVPRFVYMAFREANGREHFAYFDDILYDPQLPSGQLLLTDSINQTPQNLPLVGNLSENSTQLDTDVQYGVQTASVYEGDQVIFYIDAYDDNSGVMEMQFSENSDFSDAVWEPFAPTKLWSSDTEGLKTVYARFRDSAGNISFYNHLEFLYDVNAPYGFVYFENPWVSSNETFVTVNTYAFDGDSEDDNVISSELPYAGVISDMRISFEPTFANSIWQPYSNSVVLPLDFAVSPTVYVQFRDSVGHISSTVSDTLKMDSTAPELYALATPGTELTRKVSLAAYDQDSGVKAMLLSNDPLMVEEVVYQAYNDVIDWTFDDRLVLWIVVEDNAGNRSQSVPVYATTATIVDSYQVYLPTVIR